MKAPRASAIALLSGFKTWMTRPRPDPEPDFGSLDATDKFRSCGRAAGAQDRQTRNSRCTDQIDRWPPGPSLDNYS